MRAYLDRPGFQDTVKKLGGNIVLGMPFGLLLPVLIPRARGIVRVAAVTALVMLFAGTSWVRCLHYNSSAGSRGSEQPGVVSAHPVECRVDPSQVVAAARRAAGVLQLDCRGVQFGREQRQVRRARNPPGSDWGTLGTSQCPLECRHFSRLKLR